jgi:hypothetical protein
MSSRITKLISIPIISAYLLINAQAAGAACPQHTSFICRLIVWGGWPSPNTHKGDDPEKRLTEIQDRMAKAPVTATIYLEKGYLNSQVGNYPQSRENYTQGLGLTISAKDLKGQALALEGLAIESLRLEDTKAARAHLIQARSLYQQLGEPLLANEMTLYLIKIPKQK